MKQNFCLASVGDAEVYGLDGELLITGNMLTDSNINFTASEQEIRGGYMNKLLARFLTDSKLDFELNSVAFNLESIALNVGAVIEVGANCQTVETITCATNGELVVTNEPQLFASIPNKICWISKAGENDFTKYDFDTTNTKKVYVESAQVGDVYCVKYMKEDASAQEIKVPTSFMPSMVSALIKLPLLKIGAKGVGSSTKVGVVEIEVPLAQFNGTGVSLSLSSSGSTTVPLSFTALDSGETVSCEDTTGVYAKVKQVVFGVDEFDGVQNIVIADSDIELEASEKQVIKVYALYGGMKAPKLLDNAKLTFTSAAQGTATVGQHTGEVTAQAQGNTTIEAVVTNHPTMIATARVTVTA